MITAYYNCIIVSDGREQAGKAVLVSGNKIVDVIAEDLIPMDARRRDLGGHYLAPGLIDLQIYGSGGLLFGGKPTVQALERMEDDLIAQGTTGFMATVATNSDEVVEQAIESAKAFRPRSKGVFLGLHLEGPFLNAARKGAHPEQFIKKAVLAEVKNWVRKAEGELKMITIAPELQDSEVLQYLDEQGIIMSCGHSNATYAEAKGFLNDPVQAATHLFNAMPPIHHRDPGLIPAIFEERPYTSIIADGIHVNYAMIKLAKRNLGDKLFFITDAVTNTSEGVYQHVFTGDRYTMPDGTLSGSALTMLMSVQNGVEQADIPLAEAVNMASLYPAELIGAGNHKGKIEKGYYADFVVFDQQFVVNQVSLQGTIQN
ncbi:MAG TPA: N-acetylglucosamine-6-phosphate deacetylase [Sphingobacteriaceae bacterium]